MGDTDTATYMEDMVATTARGPLMLSLPLMLRLRLILTTMEDTVWDPMDMVDMDTLWAMPATDTAMDTVTDTDTLWATPDMVATTARGPLMLSQPLMPPPILTTMVDTAMDTVMVCLTMVATDMATATEDTAMDTTARGPLMLSLPLMPPPIPTTDTAMDTAMDTATTVKYLPSSSYLLQTQNQGDHQDL